MDTELFEGFEVKGKHYNTVQEYLEDSIPWEWRHAICMCDQPDYSVAYAKSFTKESTSNLGNISTNNICRKCGKAARWLINIRCKMCGNLYYYQYYHHASPPNKGRVSMSAFDCVCYACMVAKHGSDPTDIPPPITLRPVRDINDILSDSLDDDEEFNFTL